jgi:hypothetical protein
MAAQLATSQEGLSSMSERASNHRLTLVVLRVHDADRANGNCRIYGFYITDERFINILFGGATLGTTLGHT